MHKTCSLRLLESSDLEFLERIENDSCLWKYSNTTEPYSHEVLKIYIQNAKQDIVEAGQQRFVIADSDSNKLGLIDLFDYEPKHARAAFYFFNMTIEALKLRKKMCLSFFKLLSKG